MTRRVDPPWTLESSENCLLELRNSLPQDFPFDGANDPDRGLAGTWERIQEPRPLENIQEADNADGSAATSASTLGEMWKGFRRGSSITSSSSPGRFFLRASRRPSDWTQSGADAVDYEEEDDMRDSSDPNRLASRDREEQESACLASQLYMSQSEFLSQLEQIIEPQSSEEAQQSVKDNGVEMDDGEMDEFGDFQSAVPAESELSVHAPENVSESSYPSSPTVMAVATTSRSLLPSQDSDSDGIRNEYNDVEPKHRCTNANHVDDDETEHDLVHQESSPTSRISGAVDDDGAAAMSTPVLLERVDSILGRAARSGGHVHDDDADNHPAACAANDSSGDATCDTQQLVQFTDSLLHAKTASGGRGQLIEEKKEEGCGSVEATRLPEQQMADADEDEETSLRTPPCRTNARGEECDVSLSSCSQDATVTCEGVGKDEPADDDSAAVPREAPAQQEEVMKVPETIEAPCIRPGLASLASTVSEMQRSEQSRIDHHTFESRLSMQLPVTDLTTLEGRFTRRRQQQLRNEESRGNSSQATTLTALGDASLNLPSFYYSSAIDDTVHVLRSLPWTLLKTEEDRVHWDERIESRLRELDASLSDVQARIATSLSTQDLDAVNNVIHEWQTQLDLALMYSDRAKGSLDEVLGHPDDVEELWRQRETVRDLHAVLQSMDDFVHDKLELDARIRAFDTTRLEEYDHLSRFAQRLALQATRPPLSKLRCLDGHRADVQAFSRRFWDRLLEMNQLTTVSACRCGEIDDDHYLRLLKQVLELDVANASGGLIGYRIEWSQTTRDALCYEADRSLVEVLFDCDAPDPSLEPFIQSLKNEFNDAGTDRTRIRAITHNLIILRFQMSTSNLATATHSLLCRIWNVLRGHKHLIAMVAELLGDERLYDLATGQPRGKELMHAIYADLLESRREVWRHCEDVVVRLFTEYYSFAATPSLFDGEDDSRWSQDIDSLRQVQSLVEQFLSLRAWHTDELSATSNDFGMIQDSDLYDSLKGVLLRHLRGVHVEAMNASGRMLSSESWVLDQTDLSQAECGVEFKPFNASLARLMASFVSIASAEGTSRKSERTTEILPETNPFGSTIEEFLARAHEDHGESSDSTVLCSSSLDVSDMNLAGLSSSCVEILDGRLRLLAPRCISDGLLRWTARLFAVMKHLPLVVEEASSVLVDVLDLHLTTAFRLCCGSAKIEKVLLGSVKPTPFTSSRNDVRSPPHRPNSASSPLFSTIRKGATTSHARGSADAGSSLPAALDAEMCSPLLKDLRDVLRLRGFLLRAQDSLKDVVNLDKVDSWLTERTGGTSAALDEASLEERCCSEAQVLEKRASALLSCNVVALAIVAGLVDAHGYLASSKSHGRYADDLLSFVNFARSLVSVVPTLWTTAGQYACVRAIGGSDVVKSILDVGSQWRERELHEHPNEYVYDASERCALVWGYLCLSRKLPHSARAAVWERLVSGAYLSLLEGFSRVAGSTTEGRSLMMLDLATFTAELNGASVTEKLDARSIVASPPPPPGATGSRLDGYVETYVKMTYFPKADAVAWIEERCGSYRLNHALGLAREIADDPDDLLQVGERIRNVYTAMETEIVEQCRIEPP